MATLSCGTLYHMHTTNDLHLLFDNYMHLPIEMVVKPLNCNCLPITRSAFTQLVAFKSSPVCTACQSFTRTLHRPTKLLNIAVNICWAGRLSPRHGSSYCMVCRNREEPDKESYLGKWKRPQCISWQSWVKCVVPTYMLSNIQIILVDRVLLV